MFVCPVCYEEYEEYPYQEICLCGIQFGYEDHAGGDSAKRKVLYGKFRDFYVANNEQRLTKDQISDVIKSVK